MIKVSCIYIIKSTIKPERFYIGSAKNFKRRCFMHLWDLDRKMHPNARLQNHYNKYGGDDLYFEILEEVKHHSDLINREQFYLDLMRPFFNICFIAGSRLGVKASTKRVVSDETKRRMSESAKKVIRRSGWSHTEESKEKISRSNKLAATPERRMKQSELINARKHLFQRKVKNILTNEVYPSIMQAAKDNGLDYNVVHRIVHKVNKSNLIFEFVK